MKKVFKLLVTTAMLVCMLSIAVFADGEEIVNTALNKKVTISKGNSYSSKEMYFCKKTKHKHRLRMEGVGQTGSFKDTFMRKYAEGSYTSACTYSRTVVKSNAKVWYIYTAGEPSKGYYKIKLWTRDCIAYPTVLEDIHEH